MGIERMSYTHRNALWAGAPEGITMTNIKRMVIIQERLFCYPNFRLFIVNLAEVHMENKFEGTGFASISCALSINTIKSWRLAILCCNTYIMKEHGYCGVKTGCMYIWRWEDCLWRKHINSIKGMCGQTTGSRVKERNVRQDRMPGSYS